MPRRTDAETQVPPTHLVGSISHGVNRPQIFLRLCQAYRDLSLDIIAVHSHVFKGWFSKTIIARNTAAATLALSAFRRRIEQVSSDLGFRSVCFHVPTDTRNSDLSPNVDIIIQCDNKTGLLAAILEVLNNYRVDIIDIDIAVNSSETQVALSLSCFMPMSDDRFFDTLEAVRVGLSALGSAHKLNLYKCMVHSPETLRFIQQIDFEA